MKNLIFKIYLFLNFVKREFSHHKSVGFVSCIRFYSHGFLSENFYIYKKNLNEYLSDYCRYVKAPLIDERYGYLIDNKLLFDSYFNSVAKIIKCIGLLESGNLYTTFTNAKPLSEIIQKDAEIFLKPIKGGGGGGILFIKVTDDGILLNGRNVTKIELNRITQSLSGYTVNKRFIQSGFSNKIFSNTLNTIRVLTMISPVTNEPFIAIAVHRFGTSQSGNVDNWSSGGICSEIDIETGALSKAVGYPITGKLEWHVKHPDSGVKIEGEIVPNWDSVKLFVLQAARNVAMIPYIGWDIVLSDDEIYILEANSNSDVNLLQVHRPLLSVPEVKEFYKYHRVL